MVIFLSACVEGILWSFTNFYLQRKFADQPIQISYKMTKERLFTPSWPTKKRILEWEFYEKYNLASESFLFNKETLVETFFESVFGKLKCDCQCLHFWHNFTYLSLSTILIWTSICGSVQYKRNIQNRKIQSKRVLGLLKYTSASRS